MTITSTNTIYLAQRAANLTKPCSAGGCSVPRTALDSYCPSHRVVYRRYGHHKAGPLKKALWGPYKDAIRSLFTLNEGHAGLAESQRYIGDLMAKSMANTGAYKGAIEFQRLTTDGVTAREVLLEVCAVSMLLHECPHLLPSDRARDFAIARAVFGLAPQAVKHAWTGTRMRPYRGKAAHSSLRHIGVQLRTALAEFTVTVRMGVEARARAAAMTDEERRVARTRPMAIA